MLTRLEQTQRRLAGQNSAVDAWLAARRTLLIRYIALTKSKSLPSAEAIQEFCQHLVDYASAGHFEIYHYVVQAFEHASGRRLSLANRIIPRIEHNTELLMAFHDAYGEIREDDESLMDLDEHLNELGPLLEERFRLEDRLVAVLDLLDALKEAEVTQA
ncbi:MAG: sigma D regulator [Aeromonadaceae bacterium]|nr:sigma D regulator [Aeromonadaceae bacterium]